MLNQYRFSMQITRKPYLLLNSLAKIHNNANFYCFRFWCCTTMYTNCFVWFCDSNWKGIYSFQWRITKILAKKHVINCQRSHHLFVNKRKQKKLIRTTLKFCSCYDCIFIDMTYLWYSTFWFGTAIQPMH